MNDMAATLLLLHQLGRSRRQMGDRNQSPDIEGRNSLANTPLCTEDGACIRRFPACIKFTCSSLVYMFIGVATVVLLCVSTASTITTRYVDFDKRSLSLSPGDSIRVRDGFSYTFCRSVQLSSDLSTSFSAYLLEDEPEISETTNENFQSEVIHLKSGKYFHWKAHLLQHSTVIIETAADSLCRGLEFYVAKGRDLNSLVSAEPCSAGKCFIENMSPCGSPIEFDVHQSSDYVFVYKNHQSDDLALYVNITWHRTSYKLQRVENECHIGGCDDDVCYHDECNLAVPDTSYLVVFIPATRNSSLPDEITIELTCEPQVLSYIIMFATVPLVGFAILLPLGFIIIHIARRITPVKQSQRQGNDFDSTGQCDIPDRRFTPNTSALVEIHPCPPPYDGNRPPPPYESEPVSSPAPNSDQGQTPSATAVNEETPADQEELPENPPSYSEIERDFPVALATPT